jgi:uncharacterized protein YceK
MPAALQDLGRGALMKIAILPACLLLGGCSTLLTINSGEPYSGVKCDIAGMQKTFDTSSPYYILPHWAEGIFSAVDLPFSLVGDTVVLPYTLLQRQRLHGVEAPDFPEAKQSPRSGRMPIPIE